MGFSINGNYGNGNVNNHAVNTIKFKKDVPTENNVSFNKPVGEFGDKLLEQVQPTFVKTSKLSKPDEADLKEMFAMGGIKELKMPTLEQYSRISGDMNDFTLKFDELETTTHAEDLYESPEFRILNEFFGIA